MRSPLLVVLAATLALGVGAWFVFGGSSGGGGNGHDSAPGPQRPDVEDRTPATLEVLLFDESGRQLKAARLTLTPIAGGAPRESIGSATFEDILPGAWRIEVRAAGLWPHDATIRVEPGAKQREIVQLFDYLRVSGTVRTRFGTPFGAHPIWFLRPGETHPETAQAGQALVRGLIDRDGIFEARLPAPGDWRLSVGAPGDAPLVVGPSTSMRPGGPLQAEIVVGGMTLLQVTAIDLPVRFQRGRGYFDVQLLTRRRRAEPADQSAAAWRLWSSNAYPQPGPLELVGLPTTPTYSLGLMSRMQGEYRAQRGFRLTADARTLITLSHPAREAAPAEHVLAYELEVIPLRADQAPAGVRWK